MTPTPFPSADSPNMSHGSPNTGTDDINIGLVNLITAVVHNTASRPRVNVYMYNKTCQSVDVAPPLMGYTCLSALEGAAGDLHWRPSLLNHAYLASGFGQRSTVFTCRNNGVLSTPHLLGVAQSCLP